MVVDIFKNWKSIKKKPNTFAVSSSNGLYYCQFSLNCNPRLSVVLSIENLRHFIGLLLVVSNTHNCGCCWFVLLWYYFDVVDVVDVVVHASDLNNLDRDVVIRETTNEEG